MVLWKDFGITNSFTLETSFLGYCLKGSKVTTRDAEIIFERKTFSVADLEHIGASLAKAFAEYYLLNKQI